MKTNNQLIIPTATGTFLSILPTIFLDEILRTVILAAVGATVSFMISLLLKILFRKHNR